MRRSTGTRKWSQNGRMAEQVDHRHRRHHPAQPALDRMVEVPVPVLHAGPQAQDVLDREDGDRGRLGTGKKPGPWRSAQPGKPRLQQSQGTRIGDDQQDQEAVDQTMRPAVLGMAVQHLVGSKGAASPATGRAGPSSQGGSRGSGRDRQAHDTRRSCSPPPPFVRPSAVSVAVGTFRLRLAPGNHDIRSGPRSPAPGSAP